MKIGYARVSTDEQSLDLQLDALNQAGCERIFEEKISSSKKLRPELDLCIKTLRPGDVLVVWRLDRLGRSIKELIEMMHLLESLGVAFESVHEKIDTSSSTGKLIFHIFSALAEFEKNIIKERTAAGIQAARARGRVGGRPKKLKASDIDMIKNLFADKNNSPSEIAKRFNISRSSVYRLTNNVS